MMARTWPAALVLVSLGVGVFAQTRPVGPSRSDATDSLPASAVGAHRNTGGQTASGTLARVPARSADGNLVLNGDFEKGRKQPEHWHVRLDDFMPRPAINEHGRRVFHYISGCGKDLGTVKPWLGLHCPRCKGFIGGEESGNRYTDGHKYVSLARGKRGRGLKFTIPKAIGESQGVRVYSNVMKVERGQGFILSFDVKTRGAFTKVFVEGYRRRQKTSTEGIAEDINISGISVPVERVHRTVVESGSPANWKRFTREVVARKIYQFDYMVVKLFGGMGGEVWFDNVSMMPMSPSRLRRFIAEKNAKVKERRFRY